MLSPPTTTGALAGVRLGARERELLLLAPPPTGAHRNRLYDTADALRGRGNRSNRMAAQRAARRLRDLVLVAYEPSHVGPMIRRTALGQAVVARYGYELMTGRPIRWAQPKRRSTRVQRARAPEFAEHVGALCAEHGISQVRASAASARPTGWEARADLGRVRIPPIRSRTDYFIALHEIAHVVLGHGGRGHGVLEIEGDAWAWAIEHARVPPTQAVKACIRNTLHARLDPHAIEPPREHVFWRLLESGST